MLYQPQSDRIACAVLSGMDLRGLLLFRYKVISTQMEVNFDIHLKSIRHELKPV